MTRHFLITNFSKPDFKSKPVVSTRQTPKVTPRVKIGTGGFADALRGAMRCYPAQGGFILYVGETRDPETAAGVLRAALNGQVERTTD